MYHIVTKLCSHKKGDTDTQNRLLVKARHKLSVLPLCTVLFQDKFSRPDCVACAFPSGTDSQLKQTLTLAMRISAEQDQTRSF